MSREPTIYQPIICPQCRSDSVIKSGDTGLIVVHCRMCGTNFGFDLDGRGRLTDHLS